MLKTRSYISKTNTSRCRPYDVMVVFDFRYARSLQAIDFCCRIRFHLTHTNSICRAACLRAYVQALDEGPETYET